MTADAQPFALNAATGEEYWRREIPEDERSLSISRGVVYWEDGDDKRILYTNGEWLYAVDARTGELILSFGDRKSTRLNSSHVAISYAVFCLKKKKNRKNTTKHKQTRQQIDARQ